MPRATSTVKANSYIFSSISEITDRKRNRVTGLCEKSIDDGRNRTSDLSVKQQFFHFHFTVHPFENFTKLLDGVQREVQRGIRRIRDELERVPRLRKKRRFVARPKFISSALTIMVAT